MVGFVIHDGMERVGEDDRGQLSSLSGVNAKSNKV